MSQFWLDGDALASHLSGSLYAEHLALLNAVSGLDFSVHFTGSAGCEISTSPRSGVGYKVSADGDFGVYTTAEGLAEQTTWSVGVYLYDEEEEDLLQEGGRVATVRDASPLGLVRAYLALQSFAEEVEVEEF